MFSNWTSMYNHHNTLTEEKKLQSNFKPSTIDDHFKKKYHRYHCVPYKTEQRTSMGVNADIPFEKYFIDDQPKFHNDNYEIGKGTTKSTNFIPGYQGFIPTNKYTIQNDRLQDPYFNINKTNHILNYKIRLSSYQGFIPKHLSNIKGNARPYCLSTKDEAFY